MSYRVSTCTRKSDMAGQEIGHAMHTALNNTGSVQKYNKANVVDQILSNVPLKVM